MYTSIKIKFWELKMTSIKKDKKLNSKVEILTTPEMREGVQNKKKKSLEKEKSNERIVYRLVSFQKTQ